MAKADDVDHECRNSIVKLRAHIHKVEKAFRSFSNDIEKELAELDKHLERLECAVNPEDLYP